jgi:hypothetical protein
MGNNIRFAKVMRNAAGSWFLQIAKCYDLSPENVEWQCDEQLGKYVMTPSVDLQDALIPCKNEQEAMVLLASHYKHELERTQ